MGQEWTFFGKKLERVKIFNPGTVKKVSACGDPVGLGSGFTYGGISCVDSWTRRIWSDWDRVKVQLSGRIELNTDGARSVAQRRNISLHSHLPFNMDRYPRTQIIAEIWHHEKNVGFSSLTQRKDDYTTNPTASLSRS